MQKEKLSVELKQLSAIVDGTRVVIQPEQAIEAAARTCYKSEEKIKPGTAGKMIKMLRDRGHTAMLEFGWAHFKFVGPRGFSHELVRHRLASYAQESTRYCNYSKGKFGGIITVIEPPYDCPSDGIPAAKAAWERAMASAEAEYMNMIRAGCSPQIARSVLPICLKTEIHMACNFTEWRHVIRLRTSRAAHPDIRYLIEGVHTVLVQYAPTVFGDL